MGWLDYLMISIKIKEPFIGADPYGQSAESFISGFLHYDSNVY